MWALKGERTRWDQGRDIEELADLCRRFQDLKVHVIMDYLSIKRTDIVSWALFQSLAIGKRRPLYKTALELGPCPKTMSVLATYFPVNIDIDLKKKVLASQY